jgi:hypothetical protein
MCVVRRRGTLPSEALLAEHVPASATHDTDEADTPVDPDVPVMLPRAAVDVATAMPDAPAAFSAVFQWTPGEAEAVLHPFGQVNVGVTCLRVLGGVVVASLNTGEVQVCCVIFFYFPCAC